MIYLVKNILGKELVWFKKNGHSSFSFNHPSLITHYSNSILSLAQNKTCLVSQASNHSHNQKFKPINIDRKFKIVTPSPTPETQTHKHSKSKLINL